MKHEVFKLKSSDNSSKWISAMRQCDKIMKDICMSHNEVKVFIVKENKYYKSILIIGIADGK